MGTDKGLSPAPARLSPAVETLAALEELALRDLLAQTERLRMALDYAAAMAAAPSAAQEAPQHLHGDLGRARTGAMDALELYSHAQGARAAAQQRARWRRDEEDGGDDGRD